MSYSQFYDVSRLEQVAINLFYGWGYNFYRTENQYRADDLIIRQRVGMIIGQIKSIILAAENEYRSENILSPTRDSPFPSADIQKKARIFDALVQSFARLESHIRVLPVPENDRIRQRYRQERESLATLMQIDSKLIGQSELIRLELDNKNATWILDNQEFIKAGIDAMNETINQRQKFLS